MAITNGYCTLAEFQAYATVRGGSVGTDTTDDAVIEGIIEGTSRLIDRLTGRIFYTTTADETRYYDAVDRALVFIDDLTSDLTSIKVDYNGDRSYGDTLSSTDYDLNPYNAPLRGEPYTFITLSPLTSEYFPTYAKGVEIIGKFGYSTIPDDINEACLATALNVYNSRSGQSSPGNIQVTAAGVVVRPADVPGWAMKIINKRRRLV